MAMNMYTQSTVMIGSHVVILTTIWRGGGGGGGGGGKTTDMVTKSVVRCN